MESLILLYPSTRFLSQVSFRDLKQAGLKVQEDVKEVLREDLRKVRRAGRHTPSLRSGV